MKCCLHSFLFSWWNVDHKSLNNLLFTPALYKCNSVDSAVILTFMEAGTKRISPPSTIASSDDPVSNFPFPEINRKRDGPGTEGKTADAAWGRRQRSTSNSSQGGRYFFVYWFKGTPLKISGKPYIIKENTVLSRSYFQ